MCFVREQEHSRVKTLKYQQNLCTVQGAVTDLGQTQLQKCLIQLRGLYSKFHTSHNFARHYEC